MNGNHMGVARARAGNIVRKMINSPDREYIEPRWLSLLSYLDGVAPGLTNNNLPGISIYHLGAMRKSSTFRKALEFVRLDRYATTNQGNAQRLYENAISNRSIKDTTR